MWSTHYQKTTYRNNESIDIEAWLLPLCMYSEVLYCIGQLNFPREPKSTSQYGVPRPQDYGADTNTATSYARRLQSVGTRARMGRSRGWAPGQALFRWHVGATKITSTHKTAVKIAKHLSTCLRLLKCRQQTPTNRKESNKTKP